MWNLFTQRMSFVVYFFSLVFFSLAFFSLEKQGNQRKETRSYANRMGNKILFTAVHKSLCAR